MIKRLLKRCLPRKVLLWLIVTREKVRIRLYRSRVMWCQYGGYEFDLCIADHTAEYWYASGRTEIAAKSSPLPEFSFLKRYRLKQGALVFDIGAHQCVMALILAKIVGPDGAVVAVEASPHNAHIGKKNRDLNNMQNVHVINAAVGERCGTIRFVPTLNGFVDRAASKWYTVGVNARTVDDLASEYGQPDVLFIDVEGYEVNVLRGARQVLENSRPDCFVEVHLDSGLGDFGASLDELLSFFPRDAYDLFIARPNERHYEFERLQPDNLPHKRFFLIAAGIQSRSDD